MGESRMSDMVEGVVVVDGVAWVEQTTTVDAIDPAKDAIEANPGWRLLHVGMGSGGQTTLTYGWPWQADALLAQESEPRHPCVASRRTAQGAGHAR